MDMARWIERWKRLPRPLRVGGATALLALGVLGLFLPVLQGILFLVAGLTLLAADVPSARRLLDRLRARAGIGRPRSAERRPGPPPSL